MKSKSLVWLTAAVSAMALSACFSDPTSSLRNGPSRLQLHATASTVSGRTFGAAGTLTAMAMDTSEQVLITVQVRDDQGNYFAFARPTFAIGGSGATWANDTLAFAVPGNTLWENTLIAGTTPGTFYARITADGVTDSIAVTIN